MLADLTEQNTQFHLFPCVCERERERERERKGEWERDVSQLVQGSKRGMINSSCFFAFSPLALPGRLAPGSLKLKSTAFPATPTLTHAHRCTYGHLTRPHPSFGFFTHKQYTHSLSAYSLPWNLQIQEKKKHIACYYFQRVHNCHILNRQPDNAASRGTSIYVCVVYFQQQVYRKCKGLVTYTTCSGRHMEITIIALV